MKDNNFYKGSKILEEWLFFFKPPYWYYSIVFTIKTTRINRGNWHRKVFWLALCLLGDVLLKVFKHLTNRGNQSSLPESNRCFCWGVQLTYGSPLGPMMGLLKPARHHQNTRNLFLSLSQTPSLKETDLIQPPVLPAHHFHYQPPSLSPHCSTISMYQIFIA